MTLPPRPRWVRETPVTCKDADRTENSRPRVLHFTRRSGGGIPGTADGGDDYAEEQGGKADAADRPACSGGVRGAVRRNPLSDARVGRVLPRGARGAARSVQAHDLPADRPHSRWRAGNLRPWHGLRRPRPDMPRDRRPSGTCTPRGRLTRTRPSWPKHVCSARPVPNPVPRRGRLTGRPLTFSAYAGSSRLPGLDSNQQPSG
jgi:hypothetical protein